MKANGYDAKCVFLVGPRASGKTSLGRMLARQTGMPFVDTDQHLQEALGKSIARIVADEGWPAFRAHESRTLRQVADLHPAGCIVATGGGMVLDPKNRLFMRARGLVLHLDAPAADLEARLALEPLAEQRPALSASPARDSLVRMLAERAPLYAQAAHHRLDAARPLGEVCACALRLLGAPPLAEKST